MTTACRADTGGWHPGLVPVRHAGRRGPPSRSPHGAALSGARGRLLVRKGAQRACTADPELRQQLCGLTVVQLTRRCRSLAPGRDVEQEATRFAMTHLAARVDALTKEARTLERELRPLVTTVASELLAEYGIGVITAAQIIVSWSHPGRCRHDAAFAHLAGVAQSQRTQATPRHAGGSAATTAPSTGPRTPSSSPAAAPNPATRAYIARRITEGKTCPEAVRYLKRYLARHIYRLPENQGLDNT